MSRKVGDGWSVAADGSFAFKRGRWGTAQIAGTQGRRKKGTRRKANAWAARKAVSLLALPLFD